MSRFIQLHLLTSYPPANLNRDDLGQPKTARLGGVERLRISSQSLKRAWRTSDVFKEAVGEEALGTRSRSLGRYARDVLMKNGISDEEASRWGEEIAKAYQRDLGKKGNKKGKNKKEESSDEAEEEDSKSTKKDAMVFVTSAERTKLEILLQTLASEKRGPTLAELQGLLNTNGIEPSVDVAMFGRMLAGKKEFNIEAAVQVAHAIGVHASPIEDDYFTAVDDLNREDETGAGHVDEAGFAAALFYQYICIDREHLKENLGGDEALTRRALRALIEAALKVAPTGKQNSFASRAYAHFALAEKGNQQPRSLSLAFLKPVAGQDYASEAAGALLRLRENMDKVYGECADGHVQMNVMTGEGSAAELLDFAAGE